MGELVDREPLASVRRAAVSERAIWLARDSLLNKTPWECRELHPDRLSAVREAAPWIRHELEGVPGLSRDESISDLVSKFKFAVSTGKFGEDQIAGAPAPLLGVDWTYQPYDPCPLCGMAAHNAHYREFQDFLLDER